MRQRSLDVVETRGGEREGVEQRAWTNLGNRSPTIASMTAASRL
jgi:hypothetical protein